MILLAIDTGHGLAGRSLRRRFKDATLSGLAVIVPVLVTLLVLWFAAGFLSELLDPVVQIADAVVPAGTIPTIAREPLALLVLFGIVLGTGLLVERAPASGPSKGQFDHAVARVPIIGAIYTSFVEMSDVLLDGDLSQFAGVKLVELDEPGVYTIGFRTADTPTAVRNGTDHDEMQTLFVPSAPNPMLGGTVYYVCSDRVHDVDMTVEQGIRAIVTSGVAGDDQLASSGVDGLSSSPVRLDTPVDESDRPDEVSSTSTGETDTNKGTDVRDGT